MPRIGTLLDQYSRPESRVQIIRKGKTTTRIKRPTDYGRSWSLEDEHIETARILDDGGSLWEQHSHNPKHATYLNLSGEPTGRLAVQRVYKNLVKATMYLGENSWSNLEDFPTSQVRFDGGASAGWNPPTYQQPTTTTGQGQGDTASGKGQDNLPVSAVATEAGGGSIPRGQRVSYIRVSTAEQNLARQREGIGPVDREFQDKISARSRDSRQGLEDCIDYLRGHDQLYVASIDRLARSLVDLQGLISQITDKGASVHFLKENLVFAPDEDDPRAQLMLGILGSFAQFERSIIRERQAEGIALAKKAGKYKGRKRALAPGQVEEVRRRVATGESKVAIAQDLGIGRATLYRALAEKD